MSKKSLIFLLFMLIVSCGKDENALSPAPVLNPGQFTGIYVTDITGKQMGKIGKPYEKLYGNYFYIDRIMPNPIMATYSGFLNIKTFKKLNFTIYLVYLDGVVEVKNYFFGGANLISPMNGNYFQIFSGELQEENNRIQISFSDLNLPYGFYRVYVKTDDSFLWTDIVYTNIKRRYF